MGKLERRAEHATERSAVKCEDCSEGFPIPPRHGGRAHAAWGVAVSGR